MIYLYCQLHKNECIFYDALCSKDEDQPNNKKRKRKNRIIAHQLHKIHEKFILKLCII